ncbi:MAG: hypothetical protein CL467_02875 [Acidimicrobiaceae bacterium]|nr:hypothetical protein [Acidimicrobiaceae bacterium]|tara:strand:+ start:101 stop:961 length:861 start_codon:yes stop_codon:yes gene_type:complete
MGRLSAVGAIVLWSIGTVIIAYFDMPGIQAAFWRLTLGGVAYPVVLYVSGRRLSWRQFRLAAPAAVLFAVQLGVAFTAIKATSVANMTTIAALLPAVLMVISAIRYREPIGMKTVLMGGIALVGVVVIIRGAPGGDGSSSLRGDLLAVLGMLLFATYFVVVKEVRQHLDTFSLQTLTMPIGAAVLYPMAAIEADQLFPPLPSFSDWIWVALILLIPGSGHFLMNWAHLHVSLTVSGILTLGIPVLSAIGAWLVLDQSMGAIQIGGMVVVLAALVAIVLNHPEDPVR